jgi:U2-associated protein SR140
MSPNLFSVLGDFVRTNFGRLSQERVASTVTLVFSAWTNWGVFDPTFINDLAARFEGRTMDQNQQESEVPLESQENAVVEEELATDTMNDPSIDDEKPKGDWTTIQVHDDICNEDFHHNTNKSSSENLVVNERNDDDDDEDPDGEPLDDVDGAPLDVTIEDQENIIVKDSIDGEICDDDVDGAPL